MSQDPDVARIVRWLRLLNQRNAAAVVRDFSPDLRAVMPAPLLQLAWVYIAKLSISIWPYTHETCGPISSILEVPNHAYSGRFVPHSRR